MNNAMAIALVVALTLLLFGIRFVIRALFNKAGDAARNASVRRRQQVRPPQQQRLADRYAAPSAPVTFDRRG